MSFTKQALDLPFDEESIAKPLLLLMTINKARKQYVNAENSLLLLREINKEMRQNHDKYAHKNHNARPLGGFV